MVWAIFWWHMTAQGLTMTRLDFKSYKDCASAAYELTKATQGAYPAVCRVVRK